MITSVLTGTAHIPTLDAHYTAGDVPRMARLLKAMANSRAAVDIETFGLDADARRIKCVSIADERHAVVLNPRVAAERRLLLGILPQLATMVFHNAAFDVPNLAVNGLWDVDWCSRVEDTMIWSRLAWPSVTVPKTLDALSKRVLGLNSTETIKNAFARLGLTIKEGYKRLDVDRPVFLMGAAVDAIATARLRNPARAAAYATLTTGHPFSVNGVAGDEAWRLVDREQVINRMALRRACRGTRVDLDFLDRFRQTNTAERRQAEGTLVDAGVRPGNAGDLIRYLESVGALPEDHPRTPTGRPSTASDNLEALAGVSEVARLYVVAKELAHIEDDYLAKVVDLAVDAPDGLRVHPQLNLLAATTGRASMSAPPAHQFPAGARGILLADPGDRMVSIDWSQIEPALIANIAKDTAITERYDAGHDLYESVSQYANITRKLAKVVLLAQLYGEGLGKLARDIGTDVDGARAVRDQVMGAMPKTQALTVKIREIAKRHRKIFTLSGRMLDIPMGKGFVDPATGVTGRPGPAVHKGVNYFVQGGAYDLLAEALVRMDSAGLGDGLYLTMHDELVVSASIAHDVRRIMETPPERLIMLSGRVPVLRTDLAVLGDRWASA